MHVSKNYHAQSSYVLLTLVRFSVICYYFAQGLLRCLMRQGKVTSAVMHVDGLKEKKCVNFTTLHRFRYELALTIRPQWVHRLNTFRVEALWKLGQWEDLEQCLKAVNSFIFHV